MLISFVYIATACRCADEANIDQNIQETEDIISQLLEQYDKVTEEEYQEFGHLLFEESSIREHCQDIHDWLEELRMRATFCRHPHEEDEV